MATELNGKFNSQITVLAKDLSQPDSPKEIFSELTDRDIQVDILVNNAGFGTYGPFAMLDLQRELDMIQVDVVSLTHLTHLFLPGMLERGFGRILNLGSTGSFAPAPLMSAYAACKAFVLSFSEALSEELKGTNVRVTALCPGVTWTGFQQTANVKRMRLVHSPGGMSAEQVAKQGYHALMRGQAIVVPGLFNQLLPVAVRFFPRSLVRWASLRMMQQEGE